MKSYICRVATPQDDSAIGDLLVQSFLQTYARKLPDVVLTERRLADLRNVESRRKEAVVLALEELDTEDSAYKKIVGTLTISMPGAPKSNAWIPGYADGKMLVILPEYHQLGLSRLLIDTGEKMIIEKGGIGVSIHVRREAKGLARSYEAVGFRRAPEGDLDLLPEIFLEAYTKQLVKDSADL